VDWVGASCERSQVSRVQSVDMARETDLLDLMASWLAVFW
jgi:hypothetical protein